MTYSKKRIDGSGAGLSQRELMQQRGKIVPGFNFARFKQDLNDVLAKQQYQQDPKELECEFADAIPLFNAMLKQMKPECVNHFGCGLFEIVLLSDKIRTRQMISIHSKVLLEGYDSIFRACVEDDGMYFCVKHTNNTDIVELIGYDRETDSFRTLIAPEKGYKDFLVVPSENAIVAYGFGSGSDVELRLDNLEPIEEPMQEHVVDGMSSSKRKIARKNRYYTNMFGIEGKHMLKKGNGGKCALFAIDPVSQKHQRITGRHSRILHSTRGGTECIYAIDTGADDSCGIVIYGLDGDLLYEKQYASDKALDALSAFHSLPLGLHSELNSTSTAQKKGGRMIICNSRGKKIEGLEFNNISKSGLRTTQCIWMPRKKDEIQFGLYSLEKQYRIIPPAMLSEITFKSGIAVLDSPEGMKVVLAKDILECENKGIQYT